MSFFRFRTAAVTAAMLSIAVLPAMPAAAQALADRVATAAGHQMVTKIGGESCADFAAMLAKRKSGSSGSSSMSAKLKSNPQARTTFANIVAAPLLNKMIDCDLLPGGK